MVKEAERANRLAAKDSKAPLMEVLTEEYETPDEIWPVAKVRTVVTSLHNDFVRMMLPYLNMEDRTYAPDTPSDDVLRERLKKSSATYAMLSRSNQHKHWFEFYTDRERTREDLAEGYRIMELRVAVEAGKMTDEEALAELTRTRAGALQKARALKSDPTLTKRQVKDAKEAARMEQHMRRMEESRHRAHGKGISKRALDELRARVANKADA